MLQFIADWNHWWIDWWATHPALWLIAIVVGAALWIGGTWVQYRFRRRG